MFGLHYYKENGFYGKRKLSFDIGDLLLWLVILGLCILSGLGSALLWRSGN